MCIDCPFEDCYDDACCCECGKPFCECGLSDCSICNPPRPESVSVSESEDA
jgi:hypothetical protein